MNFLHKILATTLAVVITLSVVEATPTSVFWTNCTTDVVDTGKGHFMVDNYFTVFNRRGHGQIFAPDVGVTFGIFSWNDFKIEAGIDYLGGTDDPIFFNTKIGIAEDKLFCYAPSCSIGIFNMGTRYHGHNKTNQNIVDLVFGHTLPECIGGTFCVAGFAGNRCMGKNRQGFMVSYVRTFCPATDCDGTKYNKWAFEADYASGKNTIGGGGFCIAHYFTPNVYLETGPVWFNTAKYGNGSWKWSMQVYIDFPAWKWCSNS